jgi:light-regulated signal transduction histidine kinase (bacteriophytochrome)
VPRILRIVGSYLFSVAILSLFFWLKMIFLDDLFPDAPYLFFLFGVFIIAYYAGYGPGLMATFVSLAGVYYFFMPPQYSLNLERPIDYEIAIAYLTFGFLVTWLLDQQHQRSYKMMKLNQVLESEVEARTQELIKTNEELLRSNKELQDFAYIASHDLQEPLRKIMAFSERMKVRHAELMPKDAVEYLNRVHQSASRMRQLIEGLLTYARVSTRPLPHQPVSVKEVVESVMSDMEILIEERKAIVQLGSLHQVVGDPVQLSQVFQNLLSNSMKFQKNDESPVVVISSQIEVDEVDNSWWCRISITDNGIGFRQEYAEKIFTLFQRLHGRDEYAGAGIGLAVVKAIVDKHRGKINVKSEENLGCSFEITLPAVAPDNEEENEGES